MSSTVSRNSNRTKLMTAEQRFERTKSVESSRPSRPSTARVDGDKRLKINKLRLLNQILKREKSENEDLQS